MLDLDALQKDRSKPSQTTDVEEEIEANVDDDLVERVLGLLRDPDHTKLKDTVHEILARAV